MTMESHQIVIANNVVLSNQIIVHVQFCYKDSSSGQEVCSDADRKPAEKLRAFCLVTQIILIERINIYCA